VNKVVEQPETVKIKYLAIKPVQVGVMAFYVLFASYIWRSLSFSYLNHRDSFLVYTFLESLFLILFVLVMRRPRLPISLIYAYLLIQSAITFILILIPPSLDYLTGFYVLLSYQGALILAPRSRRVLTGIFCVLIFSSLFLGFGLVRCLALGLIPVAGCIIFPVYVIANREEEDANLESESLVQQLQEKNRQLQEHISQAEQVAAIEERNRLARELHDSVSQTMFSILLNTRSAQIIAERQPGHLGSQLEELHRLSQEALSEMRSLINQLRASESDLTNRQVDTSGVLSPKT
jgi:signal transduction histidine kinase